MVRRGVPRRDGLAYSILVGGAVVYGFLCLPAIGQRGYPRIDPAWTGATFLWVAPIALSALFDSFRFRSRRNYLVIYALATAFIFSGTMVTVVPKSINPAEMLLGTVFLFGPLHLAIGFLVEGLMQLGLWPVRRLVEPVAGDTDYVLPQISLLTSLLAYAMVCMAIGFPFAFRSLALRLEHNRGAASAVEDWEAEQSVLYAPPSWRQDPSGVEYQFDPATGFRREPLLHDFGSSEAYNLKTAELLTRYGAPDWSMKRHIPSSKMLIDQWDAKDMQPIESFPFEVTPSIVLMRRGQLTRWESTMSSGSDGLSIATERSGLIGGGDKINLVEIKVDGEVIFIRDGADWVGAFHKSGVYLGSASRR